MKNKIILLLVLFLIATSNVFADDMQAENITDIGGYVGRLMQLSAEGENNSWLILDALAAQMSEGSAVFKAILKEAENNNDRAKCMIGRFYINKGKNDDAIKWLGKISSDRYRNGRFMLATALMNKAKKTSDEVYYLGASEVLNKLKNVTVEALANTESIDFLIKACEKGSAERKIFMQAERVK